MDYLISLTVCTSPLSCRQVSPYESGHFAGHGLIGEVNWIIIIIIRWRREWEHRRMCMYLIVFNRNPVPTCWKRHCVDGKVNAFASHHHRPTIISLIPSHSIPSPLFFFFYFPFLSSLHINLFFSLRQLKKKKKNIRRFLRASEKTKNSLIGSKPCLLPLLLEGDTYASRLRGFFLYLHLYLSVDNKNKTIEQNKTGWGWESGDCMLP